MPPEQETVPPVGAVHVFAQRPQLPESLARSTQTPLQMD